jgi:hypothetical protein
MMSPCEGDKCRCRKGPRIYPEAVRVPPAFYALCIGLVFWGLWACARIHARTNPLKIAPLEMGPRTPNGRRQSSIVKCIIANS